ncbi:MAG TPA: phosphate signaling complex protein PhoU [Nocardioidaceae bacterium]|jgi:phosphate transport system protein|nr:phosphate signaling complex protein PhoU [Nocardioidaceae bacterium]
MRDLYHGQLDTVVDDLVTMTGEVRTAVRRATESLLQADARIAEEVIGSDAAVDRQREVVEDRAFEILARQQPVAGDLRVLVAALRMVADLERMGDLAVHVAKVARLRYPECAVPDELRENVARMGVVAEEMVQAAGDILARRDLDEALELERQDEEMDLLRRSQFRVLLNDDWTHGVESAVDVALLGRYYERIADHAVSLARRVVYLVTGERYPVESR